MLLVLQLQLVNFRAVIIIMLAAAVVVLSVGLQRELVV
jgi:hypothetical protein